MDQQQSSERNAPEFSVIIGRVSTEDSERILETLESLRHQTGQHRYEVLLADRRQDEMSRRIATDYPEVEHIPAAPAMSLPAMHALALERARGTYIIVTEDHCVPTPNWLASMAQAFNDAPAGTAAVGGCVENGVGNTRLDWATFFCEYSAFPAPVTEGVASVLPGINIAYRHSLLAQVDRSILSRGFWETTLHPLLLEQGCTLYSSNRIRLYHCKKFSFGLFVRQRFWYSRYYAGLRFSHTQIAKRILACVTSVLLPPVLLYRSYTHMRSKQRLRSEFRAAIPILLVFYLVWAYGEMSGYVCGAGRALEKIE